jgi:hypothetical protein
MKHGGLLLGCVAGAVLFSAGCGGDDGGTRRPADDPTRLQHDSQRDPGAGGGGSEMPGGGRGGDHKPEKH